MKYSNKYLEGLMLDNIPTETRRRKLRRRKLVELNGSNEFNGKRTK
jgi:hypothetical protein